MMCAAVVAVLLARPAGAQAPERAAEPPARAPQAAAPLREAANALDGAVRAWLREGPARRDGFTYGMDVAPLLLYAAERRDEALATLLRGPALDLIVSGEAATDGFVLWRQKKGVAPEVSGATEGIAMARAFWSAAGAFRHPDDRALALRLVSGYARHAEQLHGTWLIRKYYAFGTGHYAPMSVLASYQADFAREVEAALPGVRGLAERSYETVRRAAGPSRLLLPLIQPAVGIDFPRLNVHRYAPNDVVPLEDSCLAAEGARTGLPQVAQRVLAFAGEQSHPDGDGRLHGYYDRRAGKAIDGPLLSSTGYACLGQLAARLGDRSAAARLAPTLAADMAALAAAPETHDAPLYAAGPLLRAALALRAFPR